MSGNISLVSKIAEPILPMSFSSYYFFYLFYEKCQNALSFSPLYSCPYPTLKNVFYQDSEEILKEKYDPQLSITDTLYPADITSIIAYSFVPRQSEYRMSPSLQG
jgi:hypothetical protein